MTQKPSQGRDPNRLFERVDALMKRQQESWQRTAEEVPLLTEIVESDPGEASPEVLAREKTFAADIERVLVLRLLAEMNQQVATLRAELERTLRRSVRIAVEHAFAAPKATADKPVVGE
ncbi:MAG: hypothetical protein EXR30_04355 [Betaproteobacteria bacterium]|nr:hypothetical protein [Betaproteobacteria bacterium]MSQ87730.1 hypothetical protein [Betaproteobacteria bacterium]